MRQVTVDGSLYWLLDDQSDGSDITLGIERPADVQLGLTGRELRWPLCESPRFTQEWTARLNRQTVPLWRNAWQQVAASPVLAPVWLAQVPPWAPGGNPGLVSSHYLQSIPDGTTAVLTNAQVEAGGLDPCSFIAPLLFGKVDKAPQLRLDHDESGTVVVSCNQDDPTHRPSILAVHGSVLGPNTAQNLTWCCLLPQEWSNGPSGHGGEVEVKREQLGSGTARAETYYPQTTRRPWEIGFYFSAPADWLRLASLFDSLAGPVAALWVEGGLAESRLAADVAAGAQSITVTDATALGTNRNLFLTDGPNPSEVVTVTAINGNVLTLAAPLKASYCVTHTRLATALLAHFAASRLEITGDSAGSTAAVVRFVEVPREFQPQGYAIGAQPPFAHLYTITDLGTGAVDRATDWERSITSGANTYAPQLIQHSAVTLGLDLTRADVDLTLRVWPGCLVAKMVPWTLSRRLRLQIDRITLPEAWHLCGDKGALITGSFDYIGSDGGTQRIFSGEISGVTPDGPIAQVKAHPFPIPDRKIPVIIMDQSVFPFMPIGNPTLQTIQKNSSTGGKK